MSYSYLGPTPNVQQADYGQFNAGAVPQGQAIPAQQTQQEIPYSPVQQIYSYPQASYYTKPSPAAGAVGAGFLGAIGGATIGAFKKPYNGEGELAENFVDNVYKNYIKNLTGEEKEAYVQCKNVLRSLDKKSLTAEKLKAILEKNQRALDASGITDLDTLETGKFKKHVKNIKNSLTTALQEHETEIKEEIEDCWNAEEKKFVKENDTRKGVMEAVKKAKNKLKCNTALKYAGVGAVALGVGSYLLKAAAQKSYEKRAAQMYG